MQNKKLCPIPNVTFDIEGLNPLRTKIYASIVWRQRLRQYEGRKERITGELNSMPYARFSFGFSEGPRGRGSGFSSILTQHHLASIEPFPMLPIRGRWLSKSIVRTVQSDGRPSYMVIPCTDPHPWEPLGTLIMYGRMCVLQTTSLYIVNHTKNSLKQLFLSDSRST